MIDSVIYTGRETAVPSKRALMCLCRLVDHCAEAGGMCGYQQSKAYKAARNTW